MFGGDDQYQAKVYEGELGMRGLADELNDRWKDGFALHTIFVQGGNTVAVFERREEPAPR